MSDHDEASSTDATTTPVGALKAALEAVELTEEVEDCGEGGYVIYTRARWVDELAEDLIAELAAHGWRLTGE